MSQTLQNQILLAKSMNGIITLSDGAGTIITNGEVTTTNLNSSSVTASSLNSDSITTNGLTLNDTLTLNGGLDVNGDETVSGNVKMVYSQILGGLQNFGQIRVGLGTTFTAITVPFAQQYQGSGSGSYNITLPDISNNTTYYPVIQISKNNASSTFTFTSLDAGATFRTFRSEATGASSYVMSGKNTFAILTYTPTSRNWSVNQDSNPIQGITYNSGTSTTSISTTTLTGTTLLNGSTQLNGATQFNNSCNFSTLLPTSTATPAGTTDLIPKFYADVTYARLGSTNAFTGTNTFNTNLPTSTLTPTTSTQLITKAYGDATYTINGASLTANQTFTGVNDFSNNFSVSCPTVGGSIFFKIGGLNVFEIGQYALYSPLSIAYGSGIDQITFNIPPVFKSNIIFTDGYTIYLGDGYGAGYMQANWGGINITDNAIGTTFFNTNKMEPYSTNAVALYTTAANSQTVTFGNSASTNALSMQFETTTFNRNVNFITSPDYASQTYSTTGSTISLTGGQDIFITSSSVVLLYIPQPSAADVGKSFYISKNVNTSWAIAVSRAVGSTQTFSVDGSTTALTYTLGLSETWVKFTCVASTGTCWRISNQIVTDNKNTVCMTALSCLPPTYTIPNNKSTINTVILGYNAFAGSYTGGYNSSNTVIGSAAGFSATNSPAGEVLLGNDTYYTTTSLGAFNTAVGYRAGYTHQSTGAYNTLIGAYTDFSGANTYGNSTAIGTGAIIDASSQVVLGRTTEYVKITSANIQFGNSYRFNSVYQTIATSNIPWDVTPPANYPRYILFSAPGSATTVLTLPRISSTSVYEGMEFIFRRTNTSSGATTTSILSVSVAGGSTDVIFGINSMATTTSLNVLAAGTGAAAAYGKIVCVNKSTVPNQWAYFPS